MAIKNLTIEWIPKRDKILWHRIAHIQANNARKQSINFVYKRNDQLKCDHKYIAAQTEFVVG